MKVLVKVFPAAGLCDQTQELEITLEEGSLSELLTLLQERLSVNPGKIEELMFVHNGRAMDRREDVLFQDGDQLWLMPMLSGG